MTKMTNANHGLPVQNYAQGCPAKWENDVDTVVNALHSSGHSLEFTAPGLMRGWSAMEDRRCER